MKINCLSCGHKIDLDEAYDDFEGPIKCYVCNAVLEMKAAEGRLRSIRLAPLLPAGEEEKRLGAGAPGERPFSGGLIPDPFPSLAGEVPQERVLVEGESGE